MMNHSLLSMGVDNAEWYIPLTCFIPFMPSRNALSIPYPDCMLCHAQSPYPTTDIPCLHALPLVCPVSMPYRWHTLSSCPSPHMPSLYALPLTYPDRMLCHAQSLCPSADIPCLPALPLICPVSMPYHWYTLSSWPSPHMPSLYALPLTYPVLMAFPHMPSLHTLPLSYPVEMFYPYLAQSSSLITCLLIYHAPFLPKLMHT